MKLKALLIIGLLLTGLGTLYSGGNQTSSGELDPCNLEVGQEGSITGEVREVRPDQLGVKILKLANGTRGCEFTVLGNVHDLAGALEVGNKVTIYGTVDSPGMLTDARYIGNSVDVANADGSYDDLPYYTIEYRRGSIHWLTSGKGKLSLNSEIGYQTWLHFRDREQANVMRAGKIYQIFYDPTDNSVRGITDVTDQYQ